MRKFVVDSGGKGYDMEDTRTQGQKIRILFAVFFKAMLFAFTGGAVTVPIVQRELKRHALMEEDKVLEAYALAQSIPGAIIVNTGFFVGREIAGWPGAAAAMAATILPAFAGMLVLAVFYDFIMRYPVVLGAIKGIRAASVAVILQIALSIMGLSAKSKFGMALIAAAFLLTFVTSVNIILIVLGCGLAGVVKGVVADKRKS